MLSLDSNRSNGVLRKLRQHVIFKFHLIPLRTTGATASTRVLS